MPYETRCVKIRLKPDSLHKVREWARTVNQSRRAEALATLRDETVVMEAAFLDQTAEGDFLIYVVKAADFEQSKRTAATSLHDIDQFHQAFKRETWSDRKRLEPLVDLDWLDEVSSA